MGYSQEELREVRKKAIDIRANYLEIKLPEK